MMGYKRIQDVEAKCSDKMKGETTKAKMLRDAGRQGAERPHAGKQDDGRQANRQDEG